MGGCSGSSVAGHTKLVKHGVHHFAVSPAQMRLVRRALSADGRGCYVNGDEKRSAQKLIDLGFGKMEPRTDSNGERVFFVLAEGVST
jgi:hypothetical protein